MSKTAFAIGCHPDDIEFMMAGTLLRLKRAGYAVHYMNVANGCMGTNTKSREEITAIRREEARQSAALAGAVYHESLCGDLEVFYAPGLLARMVAVVREVGPSVILTHGPYDYMEDHVNTGRLAVTAAFCRAMTNCPCEPPRPAVDGSVTVYHSMPHTITDAINRPVAADLFVDVTAEMPLKRRMLECHRSQKEWLDISQGMGAYVAEMERRMRHYGERSGRFAYAEGWIRHNATGFCREDDNPLLDAVGAAV